MTAARAAHQDPSGIDTPTGFHLTVAPGHGALGSKRDALDHGVYLRELYDQVKAGREEGRSVAELKQKITMADYRDWGQYDAWLELNIEGMYRNLDQNP